MTPETILLIDRVRHSPEWAALEHELARLRALRVQRLVQGGLEAAQSEAVAGEVRGIDLAISVVNPAKRGNRGE